MRVVYLGELAMVLCGVVVLATHLERARIFLRLRRSLRMRFLRHLSRICSPIPPRESRD